MAQFDVFENPNQQSRLRFPYLVDVQSDVLADLATRIVIPIGRLADFRGLSVSILTPKVTLDDEPFILLTSQLAAIPAKTLHSPIGSVAHLRTEITAALDLSFTGL